MSWKNFTVFKSKHNTPKHIATIVTHSIVAFSPILPCYSSPSCSRLSIVSISIYSCPSVLPSSLPSPQLVRACVLAIAKKSPSKINAQEFSQEDWGHVPHSFKIHSLNSKYVTGIVLPAGTQYYVRPKFVRNLHSNSDRQIIKKFKKQNRK